MLIVVTASNCRMLSPMPIFAAATAVQAVAGQVMVRGVCQQLVSQGGCRFAVQGCQMCTKFCWL
jgi:hypothetical protein